MVRTKAVAIWSMRSSREDNSPSAIASPWDCMRRFGMMAVWCVHLVRRNDRQATSGIRNRESRGSIPTNKARRCWQFRFRGLNSPFGGVRQPHLCATAVRVLSTHHILSLVVHSYRTGKVDDDGVRRSTMTQLLFEESTRKHPSILIWWIE